MPIDTSIPMQVRPLKLKGSLDHYGKAISLKQLANQGKMQDMQMEKMKRDMDKEDRVLNAAKVSTVNGKFDPNVYADNLDEIDPVAAHEYRKNLSKEKQEQETYDLKTKKSIMENAQAEFDIISSVLNTVKDPITYQMGLEQLKARGIDTTDLPAQYSEQYIQQARNWAVDTKTQLDQGWKELQYEMDQEKFEETKRHNQATELNARNKKGITITTDKDGNTITTIGGSGTDGDITKPTRNKVQEKILNAGDTLSQITSIKTKFKPEYQEFSTKAGMAWNSLKDKVNSDSLMPQEKQKLDDFTQYRAEAGQLFALTLKDLSGVAVNPTEYKRAEVWLPNPGSGIFDGDSPTELKSKVERFEDFTRKALMKHAYIQNKGLTVNDVDVDQMPSLMQQRGDELTAELQSTMEGEALKNAVKTQLADEFGLLNY